MTSLLKSGIAITGGIASGKSTVCEMIKDLGFRVFSADQLAREIVEKGQPALALIAEQFGSQILNPQGELQRHELRKIILDSPKKRKNIRKYNSTLLFMPYSCAKYLINLSQTNWNNGFTKSRYF